MRNLICVVLVVFLPLTLASQTQKRFRVTVFVTGEDVHTTNILESHLKRELRILGDVDIVDIDENWHFVLAIQYLEYDFMDGRKTGYVALAYIFLERISDFYFQADRLVNLKRQPVYAELPGVAYYNRDTLDKYCVGTIGSIDKNHLAPIRKLLQ